MSDRPRVFISSTFYDLKQVRAQLREIVESLGFEALLSEFPSFPVDPDLQTVEACRKVVADHADLFVLVVGARYGSIVPGGKSVTNLEYLEARAKGIPIYVFVDKSILAILPVWKKNRDGDYAHVVDTPKLFDFVESLYATGETWVYPFETVADIKAVLMVQWPRLVHESLALRRRFKAAGLPPVLARLTGTTLRLVVEKPDMWEPLLLAELLAEELATTEDLRRDLEYGISDAPIPVSLDKQSALRWLQSQPRIALRFAHEVKVVFAQATMDAFGPPGTPTNVEGLAYAIRRWGLLYRQAIGYALDCQRRLLPEEFAAITAIIARIWRSLIEDMYTGSTELRDSALKAGRRETNVLAFTLTLKEPDLSGFNEELKKLEGFFSD